MSKFVLLDTETTGKLEDDSKNVTNHRINQLAFMVMDKNGAECFECIVNPKDDEGNPIEIDFEAMEVTNITPEMVEGKPELKDTNEFKVLNDENKEENFIVIHNAPFDLPMLERDGFDNKMKLIDTLRVAKHVYPDAPAHRLQYLRFALGLYKEEEAECKKLGIEELKAHDALGDIIFMKLLLARMKKDLIEKNKDVEKYNVIKDMLELTVKPALVKTFKFGKHKGRLVEEVVKEDFGYVNWALSNLDDPDLIHTFNHYLGRN